MYIDMDEKNNSISCFFVTVLISLAFFSSKNRLSVAVDTLSVGESLIGNKTLRSKGGDFELGFFRPGKSMNWYIGIWYRKVSFQYLTVVWVANRDKPLTDSFTSELKLLENGTLVLYDTSQVPIWSTSSSSSTTLSFSQAVLGDDGNLVVRDVSNASAVIWQSFDEPTNTWLAGGKFGFDKRTNKSRRLISWRNEEDPAPGIFSLEVDIKGNSQLIMKWNMFNMYWASGEWNKQSLVFPLIPKMKLYHVYNFSYETNNEETYFTYVLDDTGIYSRFVMDLSGQMKLLAWSGPTTEWKSIWSGPNNTCDVYGVCGSFGACNQVTMKCGCLPSFEEDSSKDWSLGDSAGRCIRKTPLQCGENYVFKQIVNTSLPENPQYPGVKSLEECELACTNKCSCNAYAYNGSKGCSIWDVDLLNLKLLDADRGGRDLYLKLAGKKRSIWRNIAIIILVITSATCGLCAAAYFFRTMQRSLKRLLFGFKDIQKDSTNTNMLRDGVTKGEKPELPLYSFAGIADATNNFCSKNKLGEGGFGPVYKGKLQNGQEIAVKRLSKSSRQGIEELKNEVILISKLQHRNLVKLLGYCGEGEEDMLRYEYMPNKSLDAFLFDSRERALLGWNKRFDIIGGIARGLLYLHRDSRLRVIHRDLKASNILLDKYMDPKISDFGMARMFGRNQTIANTSRVVGTFGYMSPEYIMGGTFSEKSDVFSFGVLMLEIVSSKRNNSFYNPEQPLNLLLHTWRLWNEGKWSEIVDEALGDSYTPSEAIKCIHIGLLCVQNRAVDRPTMAAVDLMLGSEIDRPTPREPAFTSSTSSDMSRFVKIHCSNNNLTQTAVEGR